MIRPLIGALAAIASVSAACADEGSRAGLDQMIAAHAKANRLPESIVHRIVRRESRYNARAVGRGGAMGLMQIKHGTARALGYAGSPSGLLDANTNLTYAVRYLAGAYRTANGDPDRTVSYYARGYYYAAKRGGVPLEPAIEQAAAIEAAPASRDPVLGFFARLGNPQPGPSAAAALVTAEVEPAVEEKPRRRTRLARRRQAREEARLASLAKPALKGSDGAQVNATAQTGSVEPPTKRDALASTASTASDAEAPASKAEGPSERKRLSLPPALAKRERSKAETPVRQASAEAVGPALGSAVPLPPRRDEAPGKTGGTAKVAAKALPPKRALAFASSIEGDARDEAVEKAISAKKTHARSSKRQPARAKLEASAEAQQAEGRATGAPPAPERPAAR